MEPASSADPDRDALVAFVATRDAACPVCGYNLRGVICAICPECSARLRLHIGSDNLHVGPWSVAIISLTLALGFDGVVSVLMVASILIFSPSIGQARPMLFMLGWLLVLSAICTAGLWGFFRRRRAWNRLPLRQQWRWAGAIFLGVGVLHAAVGAFLISRMR